MKAKTVSMRLSKEDNQFIENEAKKERLTKSSWIRRRIFINR
jgi:predicted DNA-binding protein